MTAATVVRGAEVLPCPSVCSVAGNALVVAITGWLASKVEGCALVLCIVAVVTSTPTVVEAQRVPPQLLVVPSRVVSPSATTVVESVATSTVVAANEALWINSKRVAFNVSNAADRSLMVAACSRIRDSWAARV